MTERERVLIENEDGTVSFADVVGMCGAKDGTLTYILEGDEDDSLHVPEDRIYPT